MNQLIDEKPKFWSNKIGIFSNKKVWLLISGYFLQILLPTIWIFLRAKIISWHNDISLIPLVGWEYVSIILESFAIALISPIYSYIKKINKNTIKNANKLKSIYLFGGLIYLLLTTIIFLTIIPILTSVNLQNNDLKNQLTFIKWQLWSNYFDFLIKIAMIFMLAIGKIKYFLILLVFKFILYITLDHLFQYIYIYIENVYTLFGISTILTNLIIFFVIVVLIVNYFGFKTIFSKSCFKIEWKSIWSHYKTNSHIAFLESILNNLFYLFIIIKAINSFEKAEAYWLAIKIIFGLTWLISYSINECFKIEINNTDDKLVNKKVINYSAISAFCFLICTSLSLWFFKPLILWLTNNQKLTNDAYDIYFIMVFFFTFYVLSTILDSFFIAKNKMKYMLYESLIVNLIFYLGFFLLISINIIPKTINSYVWFFSVTFLFSFVFNLMFYLYLKNKVLDTKKIQPIN